MNVVKDLQNLIQLMHSRDEVIVFPVGGEGQQLLDFLRYTNFLHRVCCIAATGGDAQRFIHEVPVIPFENLVHFRETALLIVAAPEQFHENIDAELTRFGFKTSIFVRNDIQVQVRNELQKMYTSGQVMMWYMRHFDEKMSKLEYLVSEQDEISTTNTSAFAEYRNAFQGKKVVIVGNGPTLNFYKPIRDAIHVGLNRAWKNEEIILDYLFTHDRIHDRVKVPPSSENAVEFGFPKVHNQIFVGKFFDIDKISYPENDFSMSGNNIRRYILGSNNTGQLIHRDICKHVLTDFWSVYSAAFQFALFGSPRTIYLVGCDTSQAGHFFDQKEMKSGQVKYSLKSDVVKVGYARLKMFAKQYYPDTEIISINPVGLRGLFKDVYTEEYKASLAENSSMTPSNPTGGGVWNKG